MSTNAPPAKKATAALPTADLAPTGRATCIQCSAAIEKGSVRIGVEREVDTGAFVAMGAGYLHPACVEKWANGEWDGGLDDLIEQVKANTALDALPSPFGAASEESVAGPAKPKKAAKPQAGASEVPGFGGLSGKQVGALAQKFLKLKEDYKADALLDKTNIDAGRRHALPWHFVLHGLLPPSHPTIRDRLRDSAYAASADAVFAALANMGKAAPGCRELAPGDDAVDRIALRAYELDPVRLEQLLDAVPVSVRTSIQLVRGRHGASLSEADRKAVLEAIARATASSNGLPWGRGADGDSLTLRQLGENGKTTHPYPDAAALAKHFGTEEAWLDALADACRTGEFEAIERVLPGLARLPLTDMVAILAGKHIRPEAAHDRGLAELLRQRGDAPEALVQAALTIDKEAHPGRIVREDLLLHGLAGMHARGTPLPPEVEKELDWTRLPYAWPSADDAKRVAWRAVMEGLGRERTLDLSRQCALDLHFAQAVTFLGVHYDEGILRDVLARLPDYASDAAFAPLGPKVLPMLVEAMAVEPPKGSIQAKRLAILRRAIQGILALQARDGRACEAAYDRWVSCEPTEGYWQDDQRQTFLLALSGMPEERRQETIDRLFAETKQPERPFFGVQTVSSAPYREKAARLLVQRYGQVADRNTLQVGLKGLGERGLAVFRQALVEEKPDPKLFQELGHVFGAKNVEAMMKAGG